MSSTALGSGDIVAERYRIDGLLGQGGMGSVYRAVQLSMGRAVALKLLATEQPATREQVERFEREAQALARLQHPSTVRLFDFGTVEPGRPFIVMELLGGADLEEDLALNGPMRWDQALRVCQLVLGSLGEAHELGIIHRDVKPANVYLCAGASWPVVKLLDFGIAGRVELASTRKLTATGTVLGSVPYMSPEQAQGQPVGPGADLYALGVVLFEMLTGQTPFAGRGFTAQLVAKVLEPAPSLHEVCPTLALPAGLCELVAELLDRDTSRRSCSAHAVSERMAALLEGHALPALERPLPSRAPRAPLAQTEPMLVPRTIADGWVPPSVPSVAFAAPRRRRRPWLALSLLLPGLAVAWWARSLHEPVVDVGDLPGMLGALAAPERGAPSPVVPTSWAATGALEDAGAGDGDAGRADAGRADAGAADLGHGGALAAPAPEFGRPRSSEGKSRAERAKVSAAPLETSKPLARPAKPPGMGARGADRSRSVPARPAVTSRVEGGAVASSEPSVATPPSVAGPAAASGTAVGGAPAGSVVPESSVSSAPHREVPGPSAALPEGASPSAASPGPSATSPSTAVPGETLPAPAATSPSPWEAPPSYGPEPSQRPQPRYGPDAPPSYGPEPGYRPQPRHSPEPIGERSARWLLRRYPTVASASEAARAGEITPNERNLVVAELRRARQHERGRAIRQYRAGYIGRGDLRARLREIDRRYEGAFERYPPAGIHVWP